MSALSKVVRAGVGRRRVQTLVMVLTTMMAVTASVLAAGLLVAAQGPFDQAFGKQKGAHLTAQFDASKVTGAQLSDTAHAPGVTAAAGPLPLLAGVRNKTGRNTAQLPVGYQNPPIDIVGRTDTGGPVDDLVVTSGRWLTGPGQIVLTSTNYAVNVGDELSFPDAPGSPTLTVVGLVRSVGRSAGAWVTPGELTALTPAQATPGYEMLYRFSSAGSDSQVSADRDAIKAAVPDGAMTSAASYLRIKVAADKTSGTYVPFVISFGVLGLVMSVLIIAVVVSGAVSAATRRIGILKSLGFTPEQIVRAYVGQALIPASIGTVLGVVLGNAAAVPVLGSESNALGSGATTVAPWIDIAVPAVILGAAALTALLPALRAGRLRTVEAIAVGRTPKANRGRVIRQVLGKLPLPRAISLGLAGPFARPARSGTMIAAVLLGSVGVSFGAGLAISLNAVQDGLNRRTAGQVLLDPVPPPGIDAPGLVHQPSAANVPAVAEIMAKQPGTGRYFQTAQGAVSVAGLAGPTTVITYTGDASWGSYQMVSGRWFHGAGEAVVPSGFLNATGTRVGDTVTLTNNGRNASVRLVGEDFDTRDSGMVILTDSGSLDGLGVTVLPESIEYDVDLTPGTDSQTYITDLTTAEQAYGVTAMPARNGLSSTVMSMDALAGMLTLMLVAVAGLGVLNTVVLDTRERTRDMGVFKALGMSPRQTVTMVLTSVAAIGLVAGAVGVPIGMALHDYVVPAMGTAAGTRIPEADIAIYHPGVLVPLVLGGLAIAVLGAVLPAGWAARTRTAVALRTE